MQMAWRAGLGLFLVMVTLLQSSHGITNFESLCRLVRNGLLIRKPGTCNEYIECIYGDGILRTCEDSLVFDVNTQNCVKATAANSVLCGNPCEKLDDLWVSDPTNCNNYFYCRQGEPISGHCDGTQHFDQPTQSCQYGSDSNCVDVANICQILPSKEKFRQENDCNEYYECKNNVHTLTSCKTTEYFDVNKAACAAKNQVACEAHSKKNVCLDSKKKPIVGALTDGATCRGYFVCANLGTVHDINPTWQQCPTGSFFDEATKKCGEPTSVVCTHNRCEGRGTRLVASSSNNCHNYILCENGFQIGERTCPWDYFFDENIESCVKTIIYDTCCDDRD